MQLHAKYVQTVIKITEIKERFGQQLLEFTQNESKRHSRFGRGLDKVKYNVYWGKLNEVAQAELLKLNGFKLTSEPSLALNEVRVIERDFIMELDGKVVSVDAKSYRSGNAAFLFMRKPDHIMINWTEGPELYIVSEIDEQRDSITLKGFIEHARLEKLITKIQPQEVFASGSAKFFIPLINLTPIKQLMEMIK